MSQLVCGDGNPEIVKYGSGMGATGGVQMSTLSDLIECWMNGSNDLEDDDGHRETPIDTDGDGIPDLPWNQTLPVVSCPGNNVSNCAELVGVVNLDLVWITDAGTPEYKNAPKLMHEPNFAPGTWPTLSDEAMYLDSNALASNGGYEFDPNMWNPTPTVGQVFAGNFNIDPSWIVTWLAKDSTINKYDIPDPITPEPDPTLNAAETQNAIQDLRAEVAGQVRWASFVNHFNLKNVDDVPAPYAKKSIYFLPNCTPNIPKGNTGGQNFGIMAKIPVLVR
jgi:hypothetical protein